MSSLCRAIEESLGESQTKQNNKQRRQKYELPRLDGYTGYTCSLFLCYHIIKVENSMTMKIQTNPHIPKHPEIETIFKIKFIEMLSKIPSIETQNFRVWCSMGDKKWETEIRIFPLYYNPFMECMGCFGSLLFPFIFSPTSNVSVPNKVSVHQRNQCPSHCLTNIFFHFSLSPGWGSVHLSPQIRFPNAREIGVMSSQFLVCSMTAHFLRSPIH